MAFDLKSLFKKTAAPQAEEVPQASRRKGLPLIGHLDIETQFRILGTVFLISLLITVAAIFMQGQATTRGTTYLSVVGQIAPLNQQVPKSVLNAMQGQKEGFTELRDARDTFSALIQSLVDGGEIKGVRVSPTSAEARPALDALREAWAKQDEIIGQLLAQENRFVALGRLAAEAQKQGKAMTEAADAAGGRLPYLTARILNASNQLGWAPGFDDAMAAQLASDIATALSLAPAESQLAKSLKVMESSMASLGADLKPLSRARTASKTLIDGWRAMAKNTDNLIKAYEAEISATETSTFSASFFGSLALVMLVLMVKAFNDEGLRRSEDADQQRRMAEAAKDATQGAILRLMNEMGDLADGDLTIRATVSEDITGAIADSVNYTVEELAVWYGASTTLPTA
jgi:twitching motility protein PilJ